MHRNHDTRHERDNCIVCLITDRLIHGFPLEEIRRAIGKLDAKIARNPEDGPSFMARG